MHLFNNVSRDKTKGSVLVFALLILAFSLVSALSIATLSGTERRASLATEKSSRSFQVADSGMEAILYKIYKVNDIGPAYDNLNELAGDMGVTCSSSAGEIKFGTTTNGYTIYFYELDPSAPSPTNCQSPDWREKITHIKSVGTSGNTTRAINVGLSAPCVPDPLAVPPVTCP